MGINYASARAMAKRLINGNGRTISFLASSSTHAAKPWRGSTAPHTEDDATEVVAKGVFVGLSLEELGFTETDVDGQLHKRGAKYCLVAPSGLVPADADITQYDAIKDGSTIWRIQKVHVLEPGDSRLLYAVEVVQ